MQTISVASDRELVARAIARCFAHWTVGFTPMSTNHVLNEVRKRVGWTTLAHDEIVAMIVEHANYCGIPVAADASPV